MKRVITILFFLMLASCEGKGTVPATLQGEWTASGQEGALGWTKDLTIDSSSLAMTGYPPIKWSADLTVLKNEPPKFLIRFDNYQFEDQKRESREVWFELSEDGKTLTFDGQPHQKKP